MVWSYPALSHDPRREVEKLRDQLAAHDKPLAFLLGAGASSGVSIESDSSGSEPLIPAVGRLTELALEELRQLGPQFAAALPVIEEDANPPDRPANIEDILSTVRRMLAAVGSGELAGLDRGNLEVVERTIQETIASHVAIGESRIPTDLPHGRFARWVGAVPRQHAVEIFTTNYDILIERSLEDAAIDVFDGFVGSYLPFFDAACLERADAAPAASWARVWKLHGSVNWKWVERSGGRRIVRTTPSTAGELILPSHLKYEESREQPYLALMDHLRRILNRTGVAFITCGYSFGDQHINRILFDALDNRRLTHVFALMHSDPDEDHALVQKALQRRNLLVLGPEYGVVAGRRSAWRLLEPIDDPAATFMDIAFDSDAVPDPASPAVTGRLRIGDFNWLSYFLDNIGPSGT